MKKLLANAAIFLTIAFLFFTVGLMVGKRNGDAIALILEDTSPVEETAIDDSAKININTATPEELASLPGIGEALAERIIAYREEYGGFQTIYELEAVSGIGDKKLESLKDLIYAG